MKPNADWFLRGSGRPPPWSLVPFPQSPLSRRALLRAGEGPRCGSSSPRKRPSESAAAGPGVGIMVPETRKDAAASPEDSIKGLSMHAFYVSCMENEGALPTLDSKGKVRAIPVINWFDCMSTAEERRMLMDKSTEAGERRKLGERLHFLVVARLKDMGAQIKVPTGLDCADKVM